MVVGEKTYKGQLLDLGCDRRPRRRQQLFACYKSTTDLHAYPNKTAYIHTDFVSRFLFRHALPVNFSTIYLKNSNKVNW